MSVINRVLKDLDRKGGAPSLRNGVLAVRAEPAPRRRRWPWVVVLLLAGLAAAWGLRPPATTSPAQPEDMAPRLRMSDTLTLPAPRGAGGEGTGAGAKRDLPPPEPGTLLPEPRSAPGSLSSAPLPQGEGRKAAAAVGEAPYPVRLDTHLPESRPPRVVKEARPATPHEQADQAWRQASQWLEQGRGREGAALLETALSLEPGHGPARQTLIAFCLENGDSARGESLLREGLRLHADDPWYNRALGQLNLRHGDLAQSLATLKAGLAKGADAAYWGLYAGVLGKAGKAAEAAAAYREAARLDPGHGPWWIGLAVSLEQSGARGEAAAAYQRALQARLTPEVRDYAARKAQELGQ